MTKVEILQQKGHNFLWIDEYLWMWDLPDEVKYQRRLAEQASGDVLVAGYGLGLVQKLLIENPLVTSVCSVELYPEVIDRCKESYGRIFGDIIIGDFYDFQTNRRFDSVVGDIWRDMEEEYLDEYRRFKIKANELVKPDGRILAWGQDFFEYLLDSKGMEVH